MEQIDYDSLNRGSTQPLLTQGDLKAQLIILPPPVVLECFQNLTAYLFDKINIGQNETEALVTLRDVLLPGLVSGEIGLRKLGKRSDEIRA